MAKLETVTYWSTVDGKLFETSEEAEQYEKRLALLQLFDNDVRIVDLIFDKEDEIIDILCPNEY